MRRVCMLGLDSLAPELLFARYWQDLPNFRRLAAGGLATVLRSCHPPITVPAWAVMFTGLDPGQLGTYGFHDRADRSYHRRRLASSLSYHEPPVWELLARAGHKSRVLGVPQTYPPRQVAGCHVVTGLLTPPDVGVSVVPAHETAEVLALLDGATADVDDFRRLAAASLVAKVRRNARSWFKLARAWAQRDDWRFLALVEMGADRLQHGLWRFCVPDHPDFVAGHALAPALRAYYVLLDELLGSLRAALRADDVLMVVSDHGAQPMRGTCALNQWLIDAGYLRLRAPLPAAATPLTPDLVDWPRTRAWADGGYVGRIYLNVRGREPDGCVPAAHVDAELATLSRRLQAWPLPDGAAVQAVRPASVYRAQRGVAPDLLVYLGAMRYRAVGSIGHATLVGAANDRGPDGANHGADGIVLLDDGSGPKRLPTRASIYDIAPTVLHYLDVPAPPTMLGQSLAGRMQSCSRPA